jgi:hypothetical protein
MQAIAQKKKSNGTNDARAATRLVVAVVAGAARADEAGSCVSALRLAPTLLIEVCVSDSSSWSRHVAALGGFALRICLPRQWRRARRGKMPGCSRRRPNRAPKLARGKAVIWRLDLRSPKHVRAFSKWLRCFAPPGSVRHAHMHTSPRCTAFSTVQNLNQRRCDLSTISSDCLAMLRACRSFHSVYKHRAWPQSIRASSSHESSAGSSTGRALRACTDPILKSCFAAEFPWAVGRMTARTTIKACAAGFRDKRTQLPLKKRWTFETDLSPLRKVLEKLRACPGCPNHVLCMHFKGSTFDAVPNLKCTERYPPKLGRMLALAVSAKPAKRTRTVLKVR